LVFSNEQLALLDTGTVGSLGVNPNKMLIEFSLYFLHILGFEVLLIVLEPVEKLIREYPLTILFDFVWLESALQLIRVHYLFGALIEHTGYKILHLRGGL
jgi:hypothetical protein